MEDLKAIRIVPGQKISHDYDGDQVTTFSYYDLWKKGMPSIGIPAKQNGLIIIDVDGISDQHKVDGRNWWENFAKENAIPQTYTVQTPSGGWHFYFKVPVGVNPFTFAPPAKLAPGVDIKWNGWVAAPPTQGYQPILGTIADIIEAPPILMAQIANSKGGNVANLHNDSDPYNQILNLHRPFTEDQINELRKRIEWLQACGTLSYDEWRNGLFALKAGVEDPEVLDELICKWTMNQAYQPGDEDKAREIAERATKHGAIGPGSIFGILKDVTLREGAPIVASPYTRQEIIDKSRIHVKVKSDGTLMVAPTESNVAAILGAMFDSSLLFHDIRNDNFVYKGGVYSDADLTNILAPMIQSPHHGIGFENIKKATISGGLDVLMAARQIDPYHKWLNDIKWDGQDRIGEFFPAYANVDNNEYTRAVSRNLWLALAARGLEPGYKFDHVVVLEGAEGARKSTLCELIGGDYYMSLATNEDINSPDTLRKMHQSTLVELPELMGLIGKSGEEIKAIITSRYDNIRALYARKAVKHARGFIMIGTTNSTKYIKREMGERRFWPIKINGGVASVDTVRIKRDREQLFAEAVHRFKSGEQFWAVPDQAKTEVHKRFTEDPLTIPVKEILQNSFAPMNAVEIYRQLEVGSYINRGFTPHMEKRIINAAISAGAEEKLFKGNKAFKLPQDFLGDFI